MNFKHCVIGNNTKENRKWLINLGYIPIRHFLNKKYICTNFSNRANCREEWKEYYFETNDDIKSYIEENNTINCINNDMLFKAISALRDDNDYMQWFTDGFHWELCPESKANIFAWHSKYKETPHKATLEELIEYFK